MQHHSWFVHKHLPFFFSFKQRSTNILVLSLILVFRHFTTNFELTTVFFGKDPGSSFCTISMLLQDSVPFEFTQQCPRLSNVRFFISKNLNTTLNLHFSSKLYFPICLNCPKAWLFDIKCLFKKMHFRGPLTASTDKYLIEWFKGQRSELKYV